MKHSAAAEELVSLVRRLLKGAASRVDHGSVLAHVGAEAELSSGYFIALLAANLIALLGLLTNSSPVIIGAMLISPLMGPILSAGVMFATGDTALWRKSLKKITISVALTVALAAAATFLSPLKDLTAEIAARTRPNLYDLLIAFLAGGVGASALCTKKNYLTIVPGVAIATAVIPPLSVSGYGLGVLNLPVFLGGFFLFFTNFVAILISTAVVFLLYGFRPGLGSEADLTTIKKKALAMALALCLVSLPLIYTLYTSVQTARLRGEIQKTLKVEFDQEGRTHLAGFSFTENEAGNVDLRLTLNTRQYLMEREMQQAEERLKKALGRAVRLEAEQVLVQAGGLKTEPTLASPLQHPAKAARTQAEVLKGAREEILQALQPSRQRLGRILSPYAVASLAVGFEEAGPGLLLTLRLRRDEPLEEGRRLTLERVLAEEFLQPVHLALEYLPVVEPLVFSPGEVEVSPAMKAALQSALGEPLKHTADWRISIEPYTGIQEPQGEARKEALKRAKALQKVLSSEFGLPEKSIVLRPVRKGSGPAPSLALRCLGQA